MNVTLIIDKYATGRYCWIIGDDDYLDPDALDLLLPILEMGCYPFISVAHRCMSPIEFRNFQLNERNCIERYEASYFECIDMNSSGSNVLGTFMSSHVFELNTIKLFDKTVFPVNTWDNFMCIFPNSYMMTSCFHNCKKCACIKTPLLTAMTYSKDWDDKLDILYTKILPDYYNYCVSLSENSVQLKHNKKIVMRSKKGTLIRKHIKLGGVKDYLKLILPRYYDYYLDFLKNWVIYRICKIICHE